ncbi:hypothetical protein ACLKA6_017308 [Drosophila palustris]
MENLKLSAKKMGITNALKWYQDYDPKNNAHKVKSLLLYNCPKVLETQLQSLDVNPIENLWILYNIYTSDLPSLNSRRTLTATYADDTDFLANSSCRRSASAVVQESINEYECWASRWNIAVNPEKSQHATFSLNRGNTTQISLNGTRIQHRPEVKYLGIIIDRRLTWKPHILRTCATVRAKCKKLDWLLRPRSGLSLTAKVRLFKAIISPTLTWGLNIWGTACNSSIKKIESCQSKILRRIVGSPWYVRDVTIYRDLGVPSLCTTVNKFEQRP